MVLTPDGISQGKEILTDPAKAVRKRLHCGGAVQGVGFRPAIHRSAVSSGLKGFVRNDPDGAVIEVEGDPSDVASFIENLPASLPPLARLDGLTIVDIPASGDSDFVISESDEGVRRAALLPPDAALCATCREEMEDPDDRRVHYPFTTCTDCGPRYTIAHELPYDRKRTSMACFPLCGACSAEYENPSDRRFHAEPVACPDCGPKIWLTDSGGKKLASGSEALMKARLFLGEGKIVAVKGLGGFHLACRADKMEAVDELRKRKQRSAKPFAVMVRDLEAAEKIVTLSPETKSLMNSPRSPIVLVPLIDGRKCWEAAAPGLKDLGVMLPTTPLHVELFRNAPFDALIMTSGNISEEPLCRGNREALERLSAVADFFLLHDRDIVRRVDDSVVRECGEGPMLLRRSRGWVPEPLQLKSPVLKPLLCLGGHLQAAAAIAAGQHLFFTQHIGDQDSPSARDFLLEAIDHLETFLQLHPDLIVTDAHPDYPTVWMGASLAEERGGVHLKVQHHLAHAAAVLGEHRLFPTGEGSAAAVLLDGTGWGPDGSAWGGEWIVLRGDLKWHRLAHLQPIPLAGGEQAVREPWRVAIAALALTEELEIISTLPLSRGVSEQSIEAVAALCRTGDWPVATGAGRIFEAAGALFGLCCVNSYEGEAAQRFEALATSAGDGDEWKHIVIRRGAGGMELPSAELLAEAGRRIAGGEDPGYTAASFHTAFCRLAADLLKETIPGKIRDVALGGGCLVNRLLRRGLSQRMVAEGFNPLLPCRVPPGDGGLAFGQSIVAAAALESEGEMSDGRTEAPIPLSGPA